MEIKTKLFTYPGDRDAVSISEPDMEECAIHKTISIIDIPAVKAVISASDPMSAYNEYKINSAKKMYESKYKLLFLDHMYRTNSMDNFIKIVCRYGFPELKNNNAVVQYFKAKLIRYETFLSKYKSAIANAHGNLGVSIDEYNKMLEKIGDTNDGTVNDRIVNILDSKRNEWIRPWGADFHKFGGGYIFANPAENLWNYITPRTIYNISLNWDIIIYCHGMKLTAGKTLTSDELALCEKIHNFEVNAATSKTTLPYEEFKKSLTKDDIKIMKNYGKANLMKLYDISTKPYFSIYGTDRGTIRYFLYLRDRLHGIIKKGWGFCDPLKTPYGTFKDVNELIRVCIENGNKRIKLYTCNPGHYEVPEEILHMPGVEISYEMNSVFTESARSKK